MLRRLLAAGVSILMSSLFDLLPVKDRSHDVGGGVAVGIETDHANDVTTDVFDRHVGVTADSLALHEETTERADGNVSSTVAELGRRDDRDDQHATVYYTDVTGGRCCKRTAVAVL